MSIKLIIVVVVILLFGSVAALASGHYRRDLGIPGRTDVSYGFPLSWHGETRPVVYPEAPSVGWLSWKALALGVVFWCPVTAILIAISLKLLKTRP